MDIEDSQKQSARLTEEEILFIKRFRNLADDKKAALVDLIKNTAVSDEYDK